MDDPGQWKCVLDRLLPSDRASLLVALPETKHLLPYYVESGDSWFYAGRFIRDGLEVQSNYEHLESATHAFAWDRYSAIEEFVRRFPDQADELLRMGIEYGDARSLELLADLLPAAAVELTPSMRALVATGVGADLAKLGVLQLRFGYSLDLDDALALDQTGDLSAPAFRLLVRASTQELLDLLTGPVYLEDWMAYEVARKIRLQTRSVPPELDLVSDERRRAIVALAYKW